MSARCGRALALVLLASGALAAGALQGAERALRFPRTVLVELFVEAPGDGAARLEQAEAALRDTRQPLLVLVWPMNVPAPEGAAALPKQPGRQRRDALMRIDESPRLITRATPRWLVDGEGCNLRELPRHLDAARDEEDVKIHGAVRVGENGAVALNVRLERLDLEIAWPEQARVRVYGARPAESAGPEGVGALEVVRALEPVRAARALKPGGIELRTEDAGAELEWVVLVEDPARRRVLGAARLARVKAAGE